MKKSNIILKVTLFVIALIFTITISKIVPSDKFAPHKLILDSLWKKENDRLEYWIDINNDNIIEIIKHHNINISGHSIELIKDGKITQIYIFRDNEQFIGKSLKFADIDSNGTKELLFVSVKNNTAFLNILSYNTKIKAFYPVEKFLIDTIQRFKGSIDAENNFIITNSSDIYLDLQGGYSVQPRNIYKYNFKNKTLIKNDLNSFVNQKFQQFTYQKKNYLLATFSKATGNTISAIEAQTLRNSTNKDTIAIYEDIKHLEYAYGDFSSYILLYNDSLNFAFEPIEFFGWTNFTKATLITVNDTPYIAAFTNALMNEPEHQQCKLVTICNLQGKIIKQIPLPYNYTDIYSEKDKIIFYGEKTLFLTDNNINPIKVTKNITYAYGYADIENDNKPEFVAFINNMLIIYSADLEINATFKIEQEFSPYPEEFSFVTLQTDKVDALIFNSRLFYYKFIYQKNNIAFLKYPFFFTVLIMSFGILFIIFRINSKRLEKENLKLEQIVKQRTKEIASQKEKIQSQAKELEYKNDNLIELSEFKKLMTDTIIHDLKNPLN
ncbi:MAG: hypothetical protein JXR68_04105, partial [Bacteroidales bacterium]|nr:hypothetical protein [Bacteroidales bacterium]